MIQFKNNNNLPLFFSTCLLLSNSLAHAENSAEQQDSVTKTTGIENVRAMAQNPLSPVYSLPLKYVYHGDANRGGVSVGSIQPIIPVSFGDWNLINQLSLNFIGTPGGITGIGELPNPYVKYAAIGPKGAAGLADLNFTSLLSPAHHGDLNWGFGLTTTMPSDAPSRELGSGKFSLGPAAAVVLQNKSWTIGVQASQIWSVFGSSGRQEVSQMQLKPIINYNLDDGWYLVSNMTIIANWGAVSGQKWTIPMGGGFGKVFAMGDYKINTRMEGYYNVDRPDQAPDWSVGTTVQLLFPE